MGVTLTFKSRSCCISCLRGVVIGGFSWIHQLLLWGARGPGSRVCQEGAAPLHRQGQGQGLAASVRGERQSPAARALVGGKTPGSKKIHI